MGGYKYCPMQAWATYTLGLGPNEENGWARPVSQLKADKGNCVHKALELLALRKLAEQEGCSVVEDEETGLKVAAGSITPKAATDISWDHHVKTRPWWDWTQRDYDDCWKWVVAAITCANGAFNPLRRDVVWPEKRFDITLDHDWARYDYQLPGWPRMQGQLCLRGTVDLVCRMPGQADVIELVDWKTGSRRLWEESRDKEFSDLRKDFQLRLYHYALAKLAPWAREIVITIVFIRDGGPFSLPFSRADLPETEAMIRKAFEEMRDCQLPEMAWDSPKDRWRCEKTCVFHLNKQPGTNKTVCQHYREELLELGMDLATAKYADPRKVTRYGSGGGRTAND